MSQDAYISSTTFRLAEHAPAAEAIRMLIDDQMDGYRVDLEAMGDGTYALAMETREVGHSFGERIRLLVESMQDHVAEPFCVTVRVDSMSDDRDELVYGGPDQGSIDLFRKGESIQAAIEALTAAGVAGAELAIAALLKRIEADEKCDVDANQPPLVFAVLEGGVVQHVVSTAPIDLRLIDYDVEGDEPELVAIPQSDRSGAEQAVVLIPFVEIDADRARHLAQIDEEHRAQREVPPDRVTSAERS